MTTHSAPGAADGWRPVRLAYGREGLQVQVPADAHVLTPTDLPGLDDQHGRVVTAVREALRRTPVAPEGRVVMEPLL